jgi:PIN domain nuclease of toxin-antitoxin system
VKILIDTQCWLWWFLAPDRLNARAHEIIAERRYPIYLSAASSWEIAIKVGLGKLELPEPPSRYVPARLADEGMDALPVEHAHALGVADLPPLHHDPFDRLLVSQARHERAALMTADPQVLGYGIETIWAGREAPPRVRPKRSRAGR